MKRFVWLGFVLFVYVICTGCGDTFRPIIIPNPPTFPNPAATNAVVSINDNGTTVPGSAMSVDVSGDTDVSVVNVGLAPVHAVQQSASQVLVVDQAVTGLTPPLTGCSVTVGNQLFNVCPSLTRLNFSGSVISGSSSTSLPPSSAPNFVATTESAQAYVSLPSYVPPSIAVVNTTGNNLVTTIPVGNNPVAIAETPDGTKLYVANDSLPCTPPFTIACSISAFNTVDQSVRAVVGPLSGAPTLSSPPIWLSARSDSQAVYALEASGTLAYLTINSTAGPDVLAESTISVPSASKMVYDGNLNRLYIPGGSAVAVVDVSQAAPSLLAMFIIVAPSARGAQDPCSTIAAPASTILNTIDVAPLPDATRAYVGTYYESALGGVNYICPLVTVINATGNALESPPIAIPGFAAYDAFCSPAQSSRAPRFRIMMAAGGDSSRAYLSSCDGGMVNIIDTSTESYLENLPAPPGTCRLNAAGQCVPVSPNPPQSPVFLISGP